MPSSRRVAEIPRLRFSVVSSSVSRSLFAAMCRFVLLPPLPRRRSSCLGLGKADEIRANPNLGNGEVFHGRKSVLRAIVEFRAAFGAARDSSCRD